MTDDAARWTQVAIAGVERPAGEGEILGSQPRAEDGCGCGCASAVQSEQHDGGCGKLHRTDALSVLFTFPGPLAQRTFLIFGCGWRRRPAQDGGGASPLRRAPRDVLCVERAHLSTWKLVVRSLTAP
eukprot:CAMPEP_0197588452 /NCGR_PEP_ID=MMETSP1326-20131121/9732_1 /TAXON_ID=1155430 /ORGANISM="Genus nov. species nov., Strain RCC2288" /LENGTH=126 /DNA_ID=CAMNT_0043153279 /DNA_START=118 /DNA_END=495 /DNA_ORIENTATION=-